VAVWTAIHASMPLLRADLDATTVVRYADAVEDQIRCRLEIVRNGLLLSEPIVTPRGDVVGTRLVLNPAEAALRRADAVLDRLAGHLGLSPAARARLGLTISQAELAVVEADRVLAAMFRPAIDEGDEDDED
jgi:phage terminase small subunit